MSTDNSTAACVAIASSELRRVLRDTLPFVGHDDPLNVVCLEAVGDVLTSTATDRYTLAHARAECDGEFDRRIVINSKHAAIIKRLLPRATPYTATEKTSLIDDGTALTVRIAVGSVGEVSMRFATSAITFPDYPSILTKVADGSTGRPFGLTPAFLARFAKIADRSGVPLRFFVHNSLSRIFVEVGGDFIGVIMPVKLGDDPTEPTVIIGHPAPAARTAQSTEDGEQA